MKYLVKLKNPEDRKYLEPHGKVGKPQSLPEYVLFESDMPISEIRALICVEEVEEESQADYEDVGWGLPWISNTPTYDNAQTGKGVDLYIIDSGIRDTHEELIGRVRTLYSHDGQTYSLTGTLNTSHGTAVAACAAGTKYGTGKEVSIVNCRSDFTTTDLVKALDTILRDHLDKPDNIPSVVNFSGSSLSSILGSAFEKLTTYGIVVVASAGNNSEHQPRYPARNMWIVAVGGINQQEQPAWFTNRRADVYGPAQDVLTASVFSDTASQIISGTSFSSPYYAGLLCCQLQGSDKFNTNKQVSKFVNDMQNQFTDSDRIPLFDNNRIPVRTMTSRSINGIYYHNPLKNVSDSDIKAWLIQNAANPQLIADSAREFNLSFSRLIRIAAPEFTGEQLTNYFKDARVTPWWV